MQTYKFPPIGSRAGLEADGAAEASGVVTRLQRDVAQCVDLGVSEIQFYGVRALSAQSL